MSKIKLTIEYDGTSYVGWQRQPNGISVQEVVERAVQQVAGETVTIVSSGRTDAGVHARGMVAHFVPPVTVPITAWREGVNRHLPDDVAVVAAEAVADDFHARYSALAKKYRYTICLGDVRSPLDRHFSWQLRRELDIEKMRIAAVPLVGKHDFAAFRSAGCDAATTVREIYAVCLKRHGNKLHIDIVGNGFLRNMVRVIVGTLIEIGSGKRDADSIGDLLSRGDRTLSGVTAPPQGLCLAQVWYEGEPGLWTAAAKPCKSCEKSLDKSG